MKLLIGKFYKRCGPQAYTKGSTLARTWPFGQTAFYLQNRSDSSKIVLFVTGRVVVVVGMSGSRSNRQAGSERAEHEPALPRVRGAELTSPALAGGGVREWARLPAQQQQPCA
jgi:hypothetical protein